MGSAASSPSRHVWTDPRGPPDMVLSVRVLGWCVKERPLFNDVALTESVALGSSSSLRLPPTAVRPFTFPLCSMGMPVTGSVKRTPVPVPFVGDVADKGAGSSIERQVGSGRPLLYAALSA